MSGEPKFSSKDDEIQYWKSLADEYLQDAERIQKESDEFIIESQQLEKEYEATIDQNEKKIKELTLANNRTQNEVESLRIKLDQCYKENVNLETEISELKNEKSQMQQYIRDLEQKNDDLERSRRVIEESIASIEAAFNSAIERNAMLESEVDEKDSLKEKLQRLADETRDLKQELLVKEKEKCPDNERILNGFKNSIVDSNRLKENETQTTPVKHDYQTPISPASRVMALNIVSDLIRKVGLSKWLCSQCGQVKCTVCPPNTTKTSSSINFNLPRDFSEPRDWIDYDTADSRFEGVNLQSVYFSERSRGLERRLERAKYDYRDVSTSELRKSRHMTKNSTNIHGMTK